MEAFPLLEQRSYQDHLLALTDKRFHCIAFLQEKENCQENEVVALLFYWEFENFFFADYFAISSAKRGSGIGTYILKQYFLSLPKTPILEIELVCDKITEKRWHFYERLGFKQNDGIYHHPPYQEGLPTFPLTILSYQRKLSAQEYVHFIEQDKNSLKKYTFYKGELQ